LAARRNSSLANFAKTALHALAATGVENGRLCRVGGTE
jgi:hypothetical protein